LPSHMESTNDTSNFVDLETALDVSEATPSVTKSTNTMKKNIISKAPFLIINLPLKEDR
jgi:hypothetical protein